MFINDVQLGQMWTRGRDDQKAERNVGVIYEHPLNRTMQQVIPL